MKPPCFAPKCSTCMYAACCANAIAPTYTTRDTTGSIPTVTYTNIEDNQPTSTCRGNCHG